MAWDPGGGGGGGPGGGFVGAPRGGGGGGGGGFLDTVDTSSIQVWLTGFCNVFVWGSGTTGVVIGAGLAHAARCLRRQRRR